MSPWCPDGASKEKRIEEQPVGPQPGAPEVGVVRKHEDIALTLLVHQQGAGIADFIQVGCRHIAAQVRL